MSVVMIVGGGAAGLSAAVAAARIGARVVVLEAGARVGKKILASGNGRCNLSNTHVSARAYNHPKFVEPILGQYPYSRIESFFHDMGLLTFADDFGRVYPVSNSASSVLDVLRLECDHLGVETRCETAVEQVSPPDRSGGLGVVCAGGERLRASAVVVTPGGGGAALLSRTGHTIEPGMPVLGPIRTETEPIRGLSGVRVRCAASLLSCGDVGDGQEVVATERGELLFRDYGLSGIMIFELSRYMSESSVITIDFLPDLSVQELETLILARCEKLHWRNAETFLTGMVHDRVSRSLLRSARIAPATPAPAIPVDSLVRVLKDFRLPVLGAGDPRQSQVTRGGLSVDEFDPDTMASHHVEGLFAAGEVLDIDGASGGYNLHWAWASGLVAGESAAHFAGSGRSQGTRAGSSA